MNVGCKVNISTEWLQVRWENLPTKQNLWIIFYCGFFFYYWFFAWHFFFVFISIINVNIYGTTIFICILIYFFSLEKKNIPFSVCDNTCFVSNSQPYEQNNMWIMRSFKKWNKKKMKWITNIERVFPLQFKAQSTQHKNKNSQSLASLWNCLVFF